MSGTRVFGTATMNAGTPGFQSPKQLRGENIGPHRIYALGCVLFELFGGKPI